MAKNEKEVIKKYNKKTNFMFVVKDLMNADPIKNKILITISRCDENQKTISKVDFFLDPVDAKCILNIVMANAMETPFKRSGSSREANRYLTVTKGTYNDSTMYSFKIDNHIKDNNQAVENSSLVYNATAADVIAIFTEVCYCIDKNNLKFIIDTVTHT